MEDLLDIMPGGVVSITSDGCIQYANPTLHTWLGLRHGGLIGRHIDAMLSVAGRIFFQTHIYPLLKLQGIAEEMFIWLRSAQGQGLPVVANFTLHETADGIHIIAVFLPMRNRERYEIALLATTRAEAEARIALEQAQADLQATNEHLQHLSTIDPLTGLQNRRAFYEYMSRAYQECQLDGTPLSLIILDIDHFKQVNDTFGHAEGDRVIQNIAQVLRQNIRQSDALARYGGEEFVLLLPNTTEVDAHRFAERIRETVAAQTSVTVSLGISGTVGAAITECDLLAQADQALYVAKRNGRNQVRLHMQEA